MGLVSYKVCKGYHYFSIVHLGLTAAGISVGTVDQASLTTPQQQGSTSLEVKTEPLSKLGLSLICSKFYLLFFPEFPQIFIYYSFFILLFSLLFHNNAHLVSVAIVT